tara:strand:- start:198 stop:317 length:120 start_codon:yes stop_codon:yes gene_type:complete
MISAVIAQKAQVRCAQRSFDLHNFPAQPLGFCKDLTIHG